MITLPRLLAAVSSGPLLALVSPPFGAWWLLWVCWVPLLWALREEDAPGNALLAYLAGYTTFTANFFWLSEACVIYSNLPPILCLAAVHLHALVFALPYPIVYSAVHPFRRSLGNGWVVAIAALLVSTEFLSPALFPWYQGSTQYRVAWVAQLGSITGVLGISFLAVLFNCALGEIVFRRREGRGFPTRVFGAALGLVLANVGFGAWRTGSVDAEVATWETVRITQIQQDIRMKERMGQSAFQAIRSWKILGDRLVGEDIDLVVWPEAAVFTDPRRASNWRLRQFLQSVPQTLKAPLLLGAGYYEPSTRPRKDAFTWEPAGGGSEATFKLEKRAAEIDEVTLDGNALSESDYRFDSRPNSVVFTPAITGGMSAGDRVEVRYQRRFTEQRNSVYLLDESGEVQQRYDKMVPLAFGEYIPLSDVFPILKEWIQGPGDFSAGEDPVIFQGPGFTFSVPICYEAILSTFVREQLSDVDLLLAVTNDAWFGTTQAPHQHAMLAANRALELGRPLYRLGYTGVSFVVTPTGHISNETRPYEEVSRVVEVPIGRIDTFFGRYGNWFPWLCVVGTLFASVVTRRRRTVTDRGPLS